MTSQFHFDVSRGPRVLNHCAAVNVRSLPTMFEGDARNCLSAHLQASNITTLYSLLGEVLVVTMNTEYPDLLLSPPPPPRSPSVRRIIPMRFIRVTFTVR